MGNLRQGPLCVLVCIELHNCSCFIKYPFWSLFKAINLALYLPWKVPLMLWCGEYHSQQHDRKCTTARHAVLVFGGLSFSTSTRLIPCTLHKLFPRENTRLSNWCAHVEAALTCPTPSLTLAAPEPVHHGWEPSSELVGEQFQCYPPVVLHLCSQNGRMVQMDLATSA